MQALKKLNDRMENSFTIQLLSMTAFFCAVGMWGVILTA